MLFKSIGGFQMIEYLSFVTISIGTFYSWSLVCKSRQNIRLFHVFCWATDLIICSLFLGSTDCVEPTKGTDMDSFIDSYLKPYNYFCAILLVWILVLDFRGLLRDHRARTSICRFENCSRNRALEWMQSKIALTVMPWFLESFGNFALQMYAGSRMESDSQESSHSRLL
jgi:hypothetical protein